MNTHPRFSRPLSRPRRKDCPVGAVLAASLSLLITAPGCEDAVRDEFRAAAVPLMESGVNAILDGLVSGTFAVLDVDGTSNTTTTTTTGATTTTTGTDTGTDTATTTGDATGGSS